jgi:hypothetical protein
MEKNNFLKLHVELPIHCKGQFFDCCHMWKVWPLPNSYMGTHPDPSVYVCFFLGWIFPWWRQIKTHLYEGFTWKEKLQKSPYFEKKGHMLPYLDNEFPLIARTKKRSTLLSDL